MGDFPCRVSVETRDYLEDRARREIEWEQSRGLRMEAAVEAMTDISEMKKILPDHPDLAGGLSSIMQDFDKSMDEINGLVMEGRTLYLANLMRNVSRLRSMLIDMHMGE